MFNWLRAIKSRTALLAGSGVLLALMAVMAALGITQHRTISHGVRAAIQDEQTEVQLVLSWLRNVQDRTQLIYALVGADDKAVRDEALRRYRALIDESTRLAAELKRLGWSPSQRQARLHALESADESIKLESEVVQLALSRSQAAAIQLLATRVVPAHDSVENSLTRMIESRRMAVFDAIASSNRSANRLIVVISGVGIALVLLTGLTTVLIIRRGMRTEGALQFEKELAQVTLHSIGDGVITTDAGGLVEYLNPVAERYTGWRTEEARGRPLADVYRVFEERSGKIGESLYRADGGAFPGHTDTESVRLVDRGGKECSIGYSQAPIRGRDGRTLGMIVVFHDISQIRAMAQQLTWQASHDALTGLVNRREFERRLTDLIETAKAEGREHALLFMDLDNFKAVNDTCGHSAGDELLRQLTAVMMSRMRGSDTLARLGGDEFGVLLESCPLDQALRIANAMRETIREFRFVWENKTFSVGVSIGLVPITADSENLSRVLSLADACCYEAKNKGRDRVQVHRPQDRDLSSKDGELQVASQISHAFELGQFRLYRQRILPLKPEAATEPHYEILVRMLDGSGNLVPPTGFMPTAERYNLLTSIERWVISSLVEYLYRQWSSGQIPHQPGAGGDRGFYSVNLSGASINDKSFPDFLRNLLTRYQLPHGLLCLEITETTAISNLNKAAELMHEFKGMGCHFALDDFGTGMSSFAYLKYLPVDYLKIAGMFIEDMVNDPMDYAIVDAINRISHILGIKTIAESVEDAATIEKISGLGIDFAQGYFIAEPEALTQDDNIRPAALRLA